MCHCTSRVLQITHLPLAYYHGAQSGVISRSQTWTCGAARLIASSSSTSSPRAASTTRYVTSFPFSRPFNPAQPAHAPYVISPPRKSPLLIPATTLLHSLFVPRHQQRWGDAPVHSIGAALFARKDQIHFFDDIGYQHPPFMHCPRLHNVRKERNCSCKPYQSFGKSRSHSSPPLPSRSLRPRLRPANASQFRAVASERGMGPSMRSLSNAGQLAD